MKLLILFIVGWSSALLAQPAINGTSGSLVHGNVFGLQGLNFGNKPTIAPQKYDDFSSGTPGANISNGWSITRNGVGTAGAYPTYSSDRLRHPRDTRSARANFNYMNAGSYTYLSSFGLSNQS